MSSVVKIGPWGRASGQNWDIAVAPLRLESITLNHGEVVDSLRFSYRDGEKLPQTAGPWGGNGGSQTTITLGPSEFVTEVHGEYGPYWGEDGISHLTFITNLRSYGPFGGHVHTGWVRFSVPVKKNGSIVGFFARTGPRFVCAIGVYVKPF